MSLFFALCLHSIRVGAPEACCMFRRAFPRAYLVFVQDGPPRTKPQRNTPRPLQLASEPQGRAVLAQQCAVDAGLVRPPPTLLVPPASDLTRLLLMHAYRRLRRGACWGGFDFSLTRQHHHWYKFHWSILGAMSVCLLGCVARSQPFHRIQAECVSGGVEWVLSPSNHRTGLPDHSALCVCHTFFFMRCLALIVALFSSTPSFVAALSTKGGYWPLPSDEAYKTAGDDDDVVCFLLPSLVPPAALPPAVRALPAPKPSPW